MFRFNGLFAGFVLVAFLSALSFLACGGQRPAPLVSSSTNYRLCQYDLHCPGGMYCSAGVCDSDCQEDTDCADGLGCDVRGHCSASGTVTTPPVYAGHLVPPPPTLALSPSNPSGTFTLQNDGVEAIGRYHVVSDDPNVSATPSGGTLASGESVTIQVQVAPAFTGTGATIHILSTGGRADVGVGFVSVLSGRLQGTVDVEFPFALGSAPFAMEISGPPEAMDGGVDGTASLLWPVNAAVAASDIGGNFTASFVFVSQSGEPGDPLFDVPVQRSVQLIGVHSATDPQLVTGTYSETIAGMPGGALSTSGTFQLRRASKATGVQGQPPPTFLAKPTTGLPSACACTNPPCTGNPAQDANWFFAQGFPFEQWQAASSYTGGQCVIPPGYTGPCAVPSDIQCALGGFNAAGVKDGLVDVWRAQATLSLLTGKSALASVLQPVDFGNLSIGSEILNLEAAETSLNAGLHDAVGGGGVLLSANFAAARTPSVLPLFGMFSTRDDPQNPFFSDTQRFGGVVAASLFAASEEVDRQQRGGNLFDGGVQYEAQAAASGALLDLAALGALLEPDAGPGPDGDGGPLPESDQISGLVSGFAPLAGTFENAVKGLNAAGYTSTYVPFAYSSTYPTYDLYAQVNVTALAALNNAQTAEAALITENATVDTAETALNTQLVNAATQEASEITDYCGALANPPPSTAGCGQQGGTIGTDIDDMNAAAAALQEAKDSHSAATLKLGTLNQQAQQEYADQINELTEQINDGVTIELIDQSKAEEQEVNQGMQCVMGFLTGGMSGSVSPNGKSGSVSGSGAGSIVSSCLPIVNALVTDPVSETVTQDEASANQQLVVWMGQQQVTDNAMVIAIQDAQAALVAANDQVVQQTSLFDAATSKLANDKAQLLQAVDSWERANDQAENDPAADPSFRLLQDQDAIVWAAEMREARTWCFLQAQALSYMNDQSIPEQRDCLAGESAAAIALMFGHMVTESGGDVINYGTNQPRTDLISMQTFLGITEDQIDPITGQTLTMIQQFQALLALPTNRDSVGNLQLKFKTSVAAGNGIFATDVGTDVIQSVVATIDGTALGGTTAYLTLTQSGTGQMRSYVDSGLTTYGLDSQTAIVPAGFNLSSPAGTPESPLSPNTNLFGRSVADSGWTLLLDKGNEPADIPITISDIQDIQLWITHIARTIQNPN